MTITDYIREAIQVIKRAQIEIGKGQRTENEGRK
jgi:hypothetical protein